MKSATERVHHGQDTVLQYSEQAHVFCKLFVVMLIKLQLQAAGKTATSF